MLGNGRMRHMLNVARVAREIARELGMDGNKCDTMFVLGYVHDIGYETSDNGHAYLGGETLRKAGYEHWWEVWSHGDPDITPRDTPAYRRLAILNAADMSVTADGRLVTIDERVQDIERRHGGDSKRCLQAKRLAEKVRDEIDESIIRAAVNRVRLSIRENEKDEEA